MVKFATHLQAFSRGEISAGDLLSEIDTIVNASPEDTDTLLAALDDETRVTPLPPALRAAVEERIVSGFTRRRAMRGRSAQTSRPPRVAAGGARAIGLSDNDDDDATRVLPPPIGDVGVGDTIKGRFVLEQLLGSGGMGQVFKALDRRRLEAQDRQPYVAIKVLSKGFRQHPESFMALQREAKKAQQLAHPNIVRVFDFDRDGATIFMTMEYLSGHSLESVIRAPGFAGMPLAKAMEIIAPVGSALAFAHKSGIVHCDFKPSNVFLTERGEVKVIDFGIARAIDRGEPGGDKTVFDVSMLGALTPAYASPEMIEGLEPDPRDDIYALGCVIYELLTGRHPFGRQPATRARADGRVAQPPQLLGRREWGGLQSALAFEREKRVRSVETLIGCFSPGRPIWRRPSTLVAGAAALFAAAIGVVSYIGLPVGPEKEVPQLHDIPSLVASAPCSVLTASIDDRSVSIIGYARSEADVAALRTAAQTLAGGKAVDTNILRWLDPVYCSTVELFRPSFFANIAETVGLRIRLAEGGDRVREADPLSVSIDVPERDLYVYADLFQIDGGVVHLWPPADGAAMPARAGGRVRFGDGEAGAWHVRPPFGTQLLIVFAAPQPLFDRPRPQSEPAHRYLEALRAALDEQAGAPPLLADFEFVSTEPRF